MPQKKILYLVNNLRFLHSHRFAIVEESINQGFNVTLAGPEDESVDEVKDFIRIGAQIEKTDVARFSSGILGELKAFLSVGKTIRKVKPDLLHFVTIRANIYGGIWSRLLGVPSSVYAISGLGHAFLARGFKAKIRKLLVILLYKFAIGHRNSKVIFQNEEDIKIFKKHKIVRDNQCVLIRGSGVDTSIWSYTKEPEGQKLKVLFASRLLVEKGINEFIEAVRLIKKANPNVEFIVAGDEDSANPSSVQKHQVNSWQKEKLITYLGHVRDVQTLIQKSHIFVLPSYREGLPRVLIEASAVGRAIVTTDVPGCKDVVEDKVNGLLVPAKEIDGLVSAIKHLIDNPDEREKMGKNGSQKAKELFDVNKVVSSTLNVYKDLGCL